MKKENELLNLKKEIELHKEVIQILKDHKELLLKQTGCKTIEEAKKKLEKLNKKIKSL